MKGVKLLIKQKFIARKELVVHMTTDLSQFPLTEGASTSGQPQSIPWIIGVRAIFCQGGR